MEGFRSYHTELKRIIDVIESRFDETRTMRMMSNTWWLSFVFSAIYIALVFGGRHFMQNKSPLVLRRALFLWSAGLSAFSFLACMRIYPMLYNMMSYGGFEHSVCDMTYLVGSSSMGIFAWLFPLSKLPELFDTFFIICRKSKLSFLHWYHHFSVFIYCWYSYGVPISTGMWFGVVNYSVHAVMYAYYAVRASGRNPPRWIARAITTLQLSQMFVGLFLNYTAIRAVTLGKVCGMDWFTVGISIFFYTSYAILFANFYYWTYIYKRTTQSKQVNDGTATVHSKLNGHANGTTMTSTGSHNM